MATPDSGSGSPLALASASTVLRVTPSKTPRAAVPNVSPMEADDLGSTQTAVGHEKDNSFVACRATGFEHCVQLRCGKDGKTRLCYLGTAA